MTRGSRLLLLNALTALAIAASPVASTIAQSTPEQCATIASDTDRLACYDALFGAEDASEADAITIESARPIPARPTGRGPATITFACEGGTFVVRFSFAGQLVSNTGDIAPLTLQIDQNATAVRTLTADPTNTSLSFSSPRETDAFLASLSGGTNLKVRITPVRQRSLNVDFRLPEILGSVEQLRAGCR